MLSSSVEEMLSSSGENLSQYFLGFQFLNAQRLKTQCFKAIPLAIESCLGALLRPYLKYYVPFLALYFRRDMKQLEKV